MRVSLRLVLIASCVIGATHTLVLALLLLYPDLNLDYPFMSGDSYDWISQALRFVGHDVRYPGRPPLFPLVMAGLERMSVLQFTPVLLQLLIAVTTVVLFRVIAGQFSTKIALPVSIAFFVNYAWRSLGMEIMADVPAACLILMSLGAFFRALDRPKLFVLAGLFGGLSAITQPVSLLLLLPMSGAIFLHRRGDLRTWWPWLGLLLFVGPTLMWLPVRRLWLGSPGAGPLHWALLGLHADTIPFYFWVGLAFVGLPGMLLAAWGFVGAFRRIGRDPWVLVLVTSAVLFVGFFSVAYGFAAKRFLVYAFVLVPFFWAEALSRFRRTTPFVFVCLALIGWSWLPYPDRGSSPLRLAVWPAPATYLAASPDQRPRGDVRPDLTDIRFEQPGRLLRRSVLSRAWFARKAASADIDVEVLETDGSAVFLSRSEKEDSRRYLTVTRLGNTLRRRIKFVSRKQLRPFVDSLSLRFVGRILDWQVYRNEVPGLQGTYLVVFSSDEVPEQGVSVGSPAEVWDSTAPILDTARGLVTRLPVNDDVVAVLTEPGSNDILLTYLAFLAPSTNFYVISTEDQSQTLLDLGCSNPMLLGEFSEAVVDTCRIQGYKATVIRIP
ncbi:MAG: hypothetical protein ABFS37_05740 [Acidobacteriota bacterium]